MTLTDLFPVLEIFQNLLERDKPSDTKTLVIPAGESAPPLFSCPELTREVFIVETYDSEGKLLYSRRQTAMTPEASKRLEEANYQIN